MKADCAAPGLSTLNQIVIKIFKLSFQQPEREKIGMLEFQQLHTRIENHPVVPNKLHQKSVTKNNNQTRGKNF